MYYLPILAGTYNSFQYEVHGLLLQEIDTSENGVRTFVGLAPSVQSETMHLLDSVDFRILAVLCKRKNEILETLPTHINLNRLLSAICTAITMIL